MAGLSPYMVSVREITPQNYILNVNEPFWSWPSPSPSRDRSRKIPIAPESQYSKVTPFAEIAAGQPLETRF